MKYVPSITPESPNQLKVLFLFLVTFNTPAMQKMSDSDKVRMGSKRPNVAIPVNRNCIPLLEAHEEPPEDDVDPYCCNVAYTRQ